MIEVQKMYNDHQMKQRVSDPKKFVLDEISDTLTPYGPIDTNESNGNMDEISNSCYNADQDAFYEQLLQNSNLVNLQIKTRTP